MFESFFERFGAKKARPQEGTAAVSVPPANTRRPEPESDFEVFFAPNALAINEARLCHLASLGLDLTGKTVLEVGGGIGLHTCFFESLNCPVTFTDARPENLREAERRYPHRAT